MTGIGAGRPYRIHRKQVLGRLTPRVPRRCLTAHSAPRIVFPSPTGPGRGQRAASPQASPAPAVTPSALVTLPPAASVPVPGVSARSATSAPSATSPSAPPSWTFPLHLTGGRAGTAGLRRLHRLHRPRWHGRGGRAARLHGGPEVPNFSGAATALKNDTVLGARPGLFDDRSWNCSPRPVDVSSSPPAGRRPAPPAPCRPPGPWWARSRSLRAGCRSGPPARRAP